MSVSRGKPPLPTRVYLEPVHILGVTRVNHWTMWNQRCWRFGRARKDILIDWSTGVSEDEWLSPDWQRLVNLGRRLVLAELDGVIKVEDDLLTMGTNRGPLLYFLKWMFSKDYYDLSEVFSEDCQYYCEDIFTEKVVEIDPEESIAQNRLARYIDVPLRFYRHKTVFKDIPEMISPEAPFGGQTAFAVSAALVRRDTVHIPRVPAEVQNAVLTKAREHLDHSSDILALQAKFVEARAATSHYRGNSYMYHTNKALLGFRFNLGGKLSAEWRPPLQAKIVVTRTITGSEKTESVGPSSQFKFLQTDLRDACVCTLQGLGGMRISDVGAFVVEPRDKNGLPYCLVRKPSPTGLFELFFARGRVVKGGDEDEKSDGEWLIGSQPVGCNSLPDAVKAILVLDELFKPWRELGGSKSLIVSLGRGMGPPRFSLEQPEVMLDSLRVGQISFVANNVILPSEYADWKLSTHQWRKAYAEDIVTVNPDLAPAIQEQYKHVSLSVTEAAYIGSRPYFNRLVAEQREHSTADAMYAIVEGGSISVGTNAEEIRMLSENLNTLLKDYPSPKKKKHVLRRMFAEEGIALWGQPYGDCLFRGATSLCHKSNQGAFDPHAERPLVTKVCSELCAGCSNLIISQRHKSYWQMRLQGAERALVEAESSGATAFAILCRDRIKVASNILGRLEAARQASADKTKDGGQNQ